MERRFGFSFKFQPING